MRVMSSSTPAIAFTRADPGPAMLTTRELDEVSQTRPVFVLNASGHLAYGNTRLLEFGGVGSDTPNPPGGEYFRHVSIRPGP